jgi:CRP/FNR family transcriptional regulator, cyclic AMP receptor protein
MTLTQTIQNHHFAQGLTENQVATLVRLASEVTFEENEVILFEGERSKAFYLLTAGSVAVELRTPRYAVSVQALGPGQVFGWSSLLEEQDTLFQVRARERTTALRLNGPDLRSVCRKDSELCNQILRRALKVVAGRVKATEVRFAEMCGVKV